MHKYLKLIHIFPYIFIFGIAAFTILNCQKENPAGPSYNPTEQIALYLDSGVWDDCKNGTQRMLDAMKYDYTVITIDSIQSGRLTRYKMLLMPGGDMWEYRDKLTTTGMKKITRYINEGGGYIGICGGAYFAAKMIIWRGWADEPRRYNTIPGLNLFNGIADGPIEDFAPTYVANQCQIKRIDNRHSIIKDVPSIIKPYYNHGPKFLINDTTQISIIGKTVTGEKAVIIAFPCNSGRIFLTSAHPEFDSMHSSWGLFRNAIEWCSKNVD